MIPVKYIRDFIFLLLSLTLVLPDFAWGAEENTANDDEIDVVRAENSIKEDKSARAYLEDNLGIKNPVFFVTEGSNTPNFSVTNKFCNVLNTKSEEITCFVYPVNKRDDIFSFIRRGVESDKFEETGVNADFLVVRADILKLAMEKKGPLGKAPPLDVLMYLNGDYFFMFTDLKREAFSIEQLISTMPRGKRVIVGYLNQQSRTVFDSVLKPLFSKARFGYKQISSNNVENQICYPSDVDIYIYLGNNIPDNIKTAMSKCARNIVPLTFSDTMLSSILELNPVLSGANVIDYFDTSSVMSYLETFVRVEKKYKEAEASRNQNRIKAAGRDLKGSSTDSTSVTTQTNTTPTPAVSNRRVITTPQSRYQSSVRTSIRRKPPPASVVKSGEAQTGPIKEVNKEVILKDSDISSLPGSRSVLSTKFAGVFPKLKKSLVADTRDSIYITGNTSIKTFGIRNVLVASRYTKQDSAFQVFDLIMKDYLVTKDNFLTPDMSKFSISDVVLGTSHSRIFNFHPAIFSYPMLMLENRNRKTKEQALIIKLLASTLQNVTPPPSYGPQAPDVKQLNSIYEKLKDLNQKKQELAAIRIFQRDIENAQRAIRTLQQGGEIPDSILKSTGLSGVDLITGDDVSVLGDPQLPSVPLEDGEIPPPPPTEETPSALPSETPSETPSALPSETPSEPK